jgi:hypothetical protein
MEFVEAVRLVYNLASDMDLVVDEGAPHEIAAAGRMRQRSA